MKKNYFDRTIAFAIVLFVFVAFQISSAHALDEKAMYVKKLTSQLLEVTDFTDNTNTTGYIDFTFALPKEAIVLGWKARVTAGFTGDTTATVMVGISGDTDKFSANTAQSVYTASTEVGSIALAVDAATGAFASTALTPRVTVTGSSDFTLIDTAAAGKMYIDIYYIDTRE
ncbi:MAG TPA: hypothetical protein VGD14_09545 [bacterium]